jgi:hypothetical protein
LLHLTGLNHSILATHDLERARQTFAELGFWLTPRGVHPDRGTANTCVMFANTNYIELLAHSGSGDQQTEPLLVDRLKHGEGLAAVAFDSDDGEQLWQELTALGIPATRPKIAQRDFDDDGQNRRVRFEILRLPHDATPRLKAFVCRHLDPSIVYQAKFKNHGNTAQTIKALTLRVDHPDTVRSAYQTLLGPPQVADGCLTFATGNCLLRFAPANWICQNLWTCGTAADCPESVVTIACGDPDRAGQLAKERGFPVHALAGGCLIADPAQTCGVGLIYEPAS